MLTEPILAAVASACTDCAPCPKCMLVGCIGHPATITGMKLPRPVELAELAAEFDGGRGPPGRIEAHEELPIVEPPVEVLAAEPIVLAGALLAVALLVAVLLAAVLVATVDALFVVMLLAVAPLVATLLAAVLFVAVL